MNRVIRELKSVPGMVLSITVGLIITFWVLNILATKAPAPVSTGASWAASHASGSAYGY